MHMYVAAVPKDTCKYRVLIIRVYFSNHNCSGNQVYINYSLSQKDLSECPLPRFLPGLR